MSRLNASRLPAPEQLVFHVMNKAEVAEMIEKHINYIDENGHSVHLQSHFVEHYMQRNDGALPIATSIAELPIVLYDGVMLGVGYGLDRRTGIFFAISEELEKYLPKIDDCGLGAVARAMHYLTEVWLADVATDYQGKCTLIACALTIIEKALLPQRPAFFITAGKRGGGKTTAIHMIATAVLGRQAAAAAWPTQEEERRKALFAYLSSSLQLLVWDNIMRGTTISSATIEKALTSEFYSDRILGESKDRTVPAYTVQVFTGNNIAPRGDLVSRSLVVRLFLAVPDPENRKFSRPDEPIAWTNNHRGEILRALYTILVGNPRRRQKPSERSPAATRFKEWWEMVGSAVEQAARCHAEAVQGFALDTNKACPASSIDFKKIFLAAEADDDQENALATVLRILRERWPSGCQARNVVSYINREEEEGIELLTAIEAAAGRSLKTITAATVTWRLKAIADAPVYVDDDVLVLRYERDHQGGTFTVKPA